MPRRKSSRSSSSHKGHGSNSRLPNRYSQTNAANGKRGKSQRRILLGDDLALDLYDGPGPSGGHHAFTLQQEARNTEDRYYRRNDDRKLWQLGITFVRPQQPDDFTTEPNRIPPPALPSQPPPLPETPLTTPKFPVGTPHTKPVINPGIGLASQNQLDNHSQTRNGSSSGEEEVVFIPRNQRRSNKTPVEPQKCRAQQLNVPHEPPITEAIAEDLNALQKTSRVPSQSNNDDDDEILADYIRNLHENGEDVDDVFSLRPLGNHLDDIDSENENDYSQGDQSPGQPDSDSYEAEIFVDVNTPAVIGKRNGRFGPEYHFKPAGSTLQEALWLEGTDMTRDIQHLIDHFEAALDNSDGFGPEHENSDVQTSDDQEDVDQEPAKAPKFREGAGEDDGEDFDIEYLVNMMLGKPNKLGKFPRASKLADAYDEFDIMSRERASLANPFGRKPRKPKTGRSSKGFIHMGTDDDEAQIEIELEQYILADREKKKLRKQERNIRRQAGILGSSSTPTKSGSMDIKDYQGGVTLGKAYASIKQFLMSGAAERLSLPPMQKQDRLQIHILAHRFFMQSKSQGKGNSRFPVLYKTKQSRLFEGDEAAIDSLLSSPSGQGSRGRFGKIRGNTGRQSANGGGGGGDRTTHNKDGMIVGTGAAELSQGNKGYDMLAKMGWTTGTGLGSNRTGILDPVQAIVKNSRAGLG
ncbi:hypothetical protein TWF718_007017 [Orbilia javanica]|uniref:Protein SQS1 n=1 Tax=Orbilia javanica TaxID=47235 RepID=A0AAN8MXP7_9PEZI